VRSVERNARVIIVFELGSGSGLFQGTITEFPPRGWGSV